MSGRNAAFLLAHDPGPNRAQRVVRQKLRSNRADGLVVHDAHYSRQIPQSRERGRRKVISKVAHERDIRTKFALDLSNARDGEWIDYLHESLSGSVITPSNFLVRQKIVIE